MAGIANGAIFYHIDDFLPFVSETIYMNQDCPEGFDSSKAGCKDIDECELKTFACAQNRVCVNTFGSYECDCPLGYSGELCLDTNECTLTAYGFPVSVCGAYAICSNTLGSYYCQCRIGYIMDDRGDCHKPCRETVQPIAIKSATIFTAINYFLSFARSTFDASCNIHEEITS